MYTVTAKNLVIAFFGRSVCCEQRDLKFCKLTVVLPATLVKYTLISPIVIWSVQLLSYTIKLTKMSKYGRNRRM